MKLLIDSSDRDTIKIEVDGKNFTTSSKDRGTQKMLTFIDESLTGLGKKASDISEISVSTGPGSYTGLRVGVTIANTLGWVLGVPVNGNPVGDKEYIDINY